MSSEHIEKELTESLNKVISHIDLNKIEDHSIIFKNIGNARIVLMGEATHGTKEFYEMRIALSKKLIQEHNFNAIAIEGDWPSAHRIHRFIQALDENDSNESCLDAFKRFPTWMWRNKTLSPFLGWLKKYNDNCSKANQKIGFYGLDLYSLQESIQSVINYMQINDPESSKKTEAHYSCFDHVAVDPQLYGYLVQQNIKQACVKEVTQQLLEIQCKRYSQLEKELKDQDDTLYYATQNARLIKNAEEYYRSLFEPRATSWNIRDQHMAQTLSNLISHLETKLNAPAKVIVWAHNSHVGDARATEMNDRGEINLGQLIREQYDATSYLLGFSTYEGKVTAASSWDGPAEYKNVLPALAGSYEALFHRVSTDNFFLSLRGKSHILDLLKIPQLQRAIGVIYLPETERLSHYYFSRLPYQFDGIIHIDHTNAIVSLEKTPFVNEEEFPDTYPSGI